MTRELSVIGAGYVGLPLAQVFAEAGVPTVLVDIDERVVEGINRGGSHIDDVPGDAVRGLVGEGLLGATTDYDVNAETDAVLIAFPPRSRASASPTCRSSSGPAGSSGAATAPGTPRRARVDDVSRNDEGGAEADPRDGRPRRRRGLPSRLLAGAGRPWTNGLDDAQHAEDRRRADTAACTERASAFYGRALETIVPVSSPDAAELVKLLENIFRSVNIALVNELAQLCDRIGVDVWEVVEAAATKPFGFMSFKPGPGLGGHCLPVDPFYLSWKAREFDFYTEFIELAGKVNENMPFFCFQKIGRALNDQGGPSRAVVFICSGSRTRRTSATARVAVAQVDRAASESGAEIGYTDAHVPTLPEFGLVSEELDEAVADGRLRRRRHRA